jgi:iron-sulfur cluster assembly protein
MASRQIMTVTSAAVKRLRTLLTQKTDPDILGIKVGLARKGCENLSYTLNYAKEIGKFDEVIEPVEGVKVVVDSKAVMYLIGTEMDFSENEILSEFTFNNPNSKSSCGCGKSFSV